MTASTLSHEQKKRRPVHVAGLGYGLAYSLAFGLVAWGYDAWALAHSNAELAWAKLELGLPLLLLLGAATGVLAGRSDRAGVWVGAWMVCGALIGIIIGEMPFAGHNLATWIAEPRLWRVNVYPIGSAGVARAVFVAAVAGCAGSAVGLAGHLLTKRARAPASPADRTGGRRFPAAVLILCLTFGVLPGLLADEIINSALRTAQQTVHRAISVDSAAGLTHGGLAPYHDQLSASYTLHLVDHDLDTQVQDTIDVAFDNGFAVRCQVPGYRLAGCHPISPRFEAWMDNLIQEALNGEPGTEPDIQADRIPVDEHTQNWLASQRENMSERYEVHRDTQRGDRVIMSARFDTGYVLTCYFRGDSPVILDHCSGNQETRSVTAHPPAG